MALVLADRVQETTTTAGTGTITLAGAVTGYQSFAVIGNGNTTYYALTNGANWELGVGTYSTTGPTLARTTILSSSNAGSAITLTGTSTVFCTYPAGRSVEKDAANNFALDAGTATTAPLVFVSGTNLTSATAGAMEYDGKVLYATPQGTQRGVVPGMQTYRLNSTVVGSNVTTAQSVFGVGVTLSSNTVYRFNAVYALSKTAGTTSHLINLLFGGTATLNNIAYLNVGLFKSTGFAGVTAPDVASFIQTAAATAVTVTTTGASVQYIANISGSVSVNAGGTFIPQYQLTPNAPGGAYTTAIGSHFEIWPVGASGSNTSVGSWA